MNRIFLQDMVCMQHTARKATLVDLDLARETLIKSSVWLELEKGWPPLIFNVNKIFAL
jgi:hypothetical protein